MVTHAIATVLIDRLNSVAPAADARPRKPGIKLSDTDIFLVIEANGPSSGPVLCGAALPRCRVAVMVTLSGGRHIRGIPICLGASTVLVEPDGREDLGGGHDFDDCGRRRQSVSAAAAVLTQRRRLATPPAG